MGGLSMPKINVGSKPLQPAENLLHKSTESLDVGKASRDQANKDKANLEQYQQTMAAAGMNELGQYNATTDLSPEQNQALQHQKDIETAQMRQALSSMGISDSSSALTGLSTISKSIISQHDTELNAERQTHWNNFIQAMGFASGSQDVLNSMSEADKTAAMNAYAGGMQAISTLAGAAKYSDGTPSAISDPFNLLPSSNDLSSEMVPMQSIDNTGMQSIQEVQ